MTQTTTFALGLGVLFAIGWSASGCGDSGKSVKNPDSSTMADGASGNGGSSGAGDVAGNGGGTGNGGASGSGGGPGPDARSADAASDAPAQEVRNDVSSPSDLPAQEVKKDVNTVLDVPLRLDAPMDVPIMDASTFEAQKDQAPAQPDLPSASTELFANGFFSIGVFLQGKYDFQKWKDRGVNTIVAEQVWEETPGESWDHQVRAWTDAAAALGLKVIRRALTNPRDDIGNTTLLAWFQGDEPDASGQGIPNLPEYIARYDAWHAADPTRPIYLNFAGPDVLTAIDGPRPDWCIEATGWCSLSSNYMDYIEHALDWVSNDIYPWAGWLPDNSRRGDLTYLADPIEKIRKWTNKPQFCYIETSNQYFVPESPRGVTPQELRAEIWLAIVHGVRGFTYFTGVVPTYGVGVASDDGTPPDVAAEMKVQNAIVTELAPVLQGPIDPPSLGATVPAPLQACWRDAPGGRYYIVVNPRETTVSNAAITLVGAGSASSATVFKESRSVALANGNLTDSFGPFAVHIYVVAR